MLLNIKQLKVRVTKVLRFIGRRTFLWLALGSAGSLTLAVAELLIASFLQIFLKSLGILSVDLGKLGALMPDNMTPSWALGLLCVIGLVRFVGQFLVLQSTIESQEAMNKRLRLLATFDILETPDGKPKSAAEVNHYIGELFPKAALFCNYMAQVFAQLIQVVALSSIMIWSAWKESIVALVGLMLVGLVVLLINKKVRSIVSRVPAEHIVLTNGIERVARNLLLVKVLKTQNLERKNFVNSILTYAEHATAAGRFANLAAAGTPFFGILLVVLIIYLNTNFFKSPALNLLSFLYLFVRFVQILSSTVGSFGAANAYWPQFRASLQYFFGFDSLESQKGLSAVLPDETQSLQQYEIESYLPAPTIGVHNLSYSYATVGNLVIQRFNMIVRSGAFVGIVGPSGCGKSTLLSLILGLLQPSEGKIELAGLAPKAFFALPNCRVGYVGAEAFLLAGTLEDNLRYGLKIKVTEQDMKNALRMANLLGFIQQLPQGLAFQISANGDGLSAGQKQRLCLARALLSKPSLLILDEVSANLDDKTESEIAESLLEIKKLCTVLVVSHRKGILKYADDIVDMKKL